MWLLAQESDIPEKETAGVRIYLDESGTLSPDIPHAVVGGLVINRSHLLPFENAWNQMLNKYEIVAPLHMKEFGPNGRFKEVSHDRRRQLFVETAELINDHKICSITATLKNAEFLIDTIRRDKQPDGPSDHLFGGVAENSLRPFVPSGDDAI